MQAKMMSGAAYMHRNGFSCTFLFIFLVFINLKSKDATPWFYLSSEDCLILSQLCNVYAPVCLVLSKNFTHEMVIWIK